MAENSLLKVTLIETKSAQAYTDVMAALADFQYRRLPPPAQAASGRHVLEIGSAILQFSPNQPIPIANRVYNLGVGEPATRTQVTRLADAYASRRLPFRIELSPLARPSDLPDWIREVGGVPATNSQVFSRASAPIAEPKTSLRIERVGLAAANDFLEPYLFGSEMPRSAELTLRAYFEVPGTSFYAAYADGEAVAAGWTFVTGTSAYLAGAATKPGYRGLGAQSALLARRIKDAQLSGCLRTFVDTDEAPPGQPNPSFRNVLRAGFQPVFVLRVFEGTSG